MASELKVDKFTGVTTAGSIDVTGEGNSTTTNLSDSFNTSSVNDDATGVHNGAFTSAMSNANYANSCMKQAEATNADCTEYTTGVNSTLLVKRNDIENGSPRDAANTNTLTFGDLA